VTPSSASPLVWVDMLNSPNVLFSKPLVGELERRGCGVVVTARDFAQTVPMCSLFGLEAEVIGTHGGGSLVGKSTNLAQRVTQLLRFARRARPDVVLTHNSYSQLVVSRMLGLPSVTSMDYEHQPANHLAFRCADWLFVPAAFPDEALRQLGAPRRKVWKFPGIKEDIALAGFSPDPAFRSSLAVGEDEALVIVRPPATFALYHRFGNPLFHQVLRRLVEVPNAKVVTLERTEAQKAELRDAGFGEFVYDGPALDGPQLIAAADLVVTAGGTMAREAAVLGTPAVSLFAGRPAAIDLELEKQGKLLVLRNEGDLERLDVRRKEQSPVARKGEALVREFVDRALYCWRLTARRTHRWL